jgi:transcriptional regulator with XRE-family HTH domain
MVRNNISRREMAEVLDITPDYLSSVLTGNRLVSPSLIGKFYLRYGQQATLEVFGDPAEREPA